MRYKEPFGASTGTERDVTTSQLDFGKYAETGKALQAALDSFASAVASSGADANNDRAELEYLINLLAHFAVTGHTVYRGRTLSTLDEWRTIFEKGVIDCCKSRIAARRADGDGSRGGDPADIARAYETLLARGLAALALLPSAMVTPSWDGSLDAVTWIGPLPAEASAGGCVLHWQCGRSRHDMWAFASDKVTFGRDPTRANVRLAVEPYSPPELYAENLERSRRISGIHCSVQVRDTDVLLEHIGNKPNTYVDDTLVAGAVPVSVKPVNVVLGRDGQLPLGALSVRLHALYNGDNNVVGAWVERTTNCPERSYLLVQGMLPVRTTPLEPGCPAANADVYLGNAEGCIVLINVGADLTSSLGVIGYATGVVLNPDVSIGGADAGFHVTVASLPPHAV